MDRLSLQAEERNILGKKVKGLRSSGFLPAHIFGKKIETEHISVNTKNFLKTFSEAGETGLIDLKVGGEKIRPVLIRGVQYDPITGQPIHIDFYQVNLSDKVKVQVPLELIGEEPEKVHLGEAIVLQTLNEVEVEALPTDLVEKIEVDISSLKEINDAIIVGQLNYDRTKLTLHADEEEVVVKLAPAVSAEMEELLEEQAAEVAEAEAIGTPTEGEVVPTEGEPASAEATAGEEGRAPAEGGEEQAQTEEAPKGEK